MLNAEKATSKEIVKATRSILKESRISEDCLENKAIFDMLNMRHQSQKESTVVSCTQNDFMKHKKFKTHMDYHSLSKE